MSINRRIFTKDFKQQILYEVQAGKSLIVDLIVKTVDYSFLRCDAFLSLSGRVEVNFGGGAVAKRLMQVLLVVELEVARQSFAGCAPSPRSNMVGSPCKAVAFHWLIWFGWIPCSAAI